MQPSQEKQFHFVAAQAWTADGRCTAWSSQPYSGVRYCGDGSPGSATAADYNGGVNCVACVPTGGAAAPSAGAAAQAGGATNPAWMTPAPVPANAPAPTHPTPAPVPANAPYLSFADGGGETSPSRSEGAEDNEDDVSVFAEQERQRRRELPGDALKEEFSSFLQTGLHTETGLQQVPPAAPGFTPPPAGGVITSPAGGGPAAAPPAAPLAGPRQLQQPLFTNTTLQPEQFKLSYSIAGAYGEYNKIYGFAPNAGILHNEKYPLFIWLGGVGDDANTVQFEVGVYITKNIPCLFGGVGDDANTVQFEVGGEGPTRTRCSSK